VCMARARACVRLSVALALENEIDDQTTLYVVIGPGPVVER
jgi:hypothetical protein